MHTCIHAYKHTLTYMQTCMHATHMHMEGGVREAVLISEQQTSEQEKFLGLKSGFMIGYRGQHSTKTQ